MNNSLQKINLFVSQESGFYKVGIADWADDGNGLILFFSHNSEKVSRHSDGSTFIGSVGVPRPRELRVPFSAIAQERVHEVSLPSDLTTRVPTRSTAPRGAFVFPSGVLSSQASIAAEVVDDKSLDSTLNAWAQYPGTVSAQTVRPNNLGKNLVLTVLCSSRTTT